MKRVMLRPSKDGCGVAEAVGEGVLEGVGVAVELGVWVGLEVELGVAVELGVGLVVELGVLVGVMVAVGAAPTPTTQRLESTRAALALSAEPTLSISLPEPVKDAVKVKDADDDGAREPRAQDTTPAEKLAEPEPER